MNTPKISQIQLGRHRVGIVGLEAVLDEVCEAHKGRSERFISEKLLNLLSKKNYIPKNVQEQYKAAFFEEYRKHLGLQVEKSDPGWLEIKILGGGCTICNGLENTVMEVLSELGLPADVEHITEKERIRQYSVQDGPALVIDQKVVANGVIPLKPEIKTLLAKFSDHPAGSKLARKQVLIKNIPFSKPHNLANLVEFREGQIVSKTLAQTASVSITLFAFDKEEKISTHTAPGDAMLQVLEGQALVTINDKPMDILCPQTIIMPADVPHSVQALQRFKMLLTVVKRKK